MKSVDWAILAKYFLHGIAFSLLSIVLVFVVGLVLLFLVAIGSFIGLMLGLAVLMLAIGGLNCFLTDVIWDLQTKTSLWNLLLHGFVFFVILLVVNGFLVMVPNYIFPSIATTIITFIIGAFAGGFVGKTVAKWFESESPREEIPKETEAKWANTKL